MGSSEIIPEFSARILTDVTQKVFENAGRALYHLDTRRRESFRNRLLSVLNSLTMQDSVSFLQVGAHNGCYDDPLTGHIGPHWHGVFVEPQEELADELNNKYLDFPDVHVRCVAISDGADNTVLWRPQIDASPEANSVTSNELHRTKASVWRLLGPSAVRNATFDKITVPATTIKQLMHDHEITDLDILATDTEGCDDIVVNGVLEFARPTVILFEHRHMARSQQYSILRKLHNNGYHTTRSHKDTLAVVQ